jgi:hypothetical protein
VHVKDAEKAASVARQIHGPKLGGTPSNNENRTAFVIKVAGGHAEATESRRILPGLARNHNFLIRPAWSASLIGDDVARIRLAARKIDAAGIRRVRRVASRWKLPSTMSTLGGVRGGNREESPYSNL